MSQPYFLEGFVDLIPNEGDVRQVLERTGALRHGHFRHPSGTHSDLYLQIPLAMRHYAESKMLSVALSRLLRKDDNVRRAIPQVSVVVPATGGLPIAFGVSEALRASQTYWAEKNDAGELELRQFLEIHPGERVILVDDILRTGRKLTQLRKLVESAGAKVLALAVLVHQPFENCAEFSDLPLFKLLTLEPHYWQAGKCPLCAQGTPMVDVRV
ncbi:MAG TPA: phosphoribosyltransferase family protein [Terriglobales bacterium]|nr:phosphoribosyltransferase family protein [Terriglobales bacterium]